MLEWICLLGSTHPPCEGPEDTLVTTVERNEVVRGAPASLKSSVIALLCSSELTVGIVVTELGNLNAVGVIGSQGGQRPSGSIQPPKAR